MADSVRATFPFVKHPADNRATPGYGFDFTAALPSGVTISSVGTITVSPTTTPPLVVGEGTKNAAEDTFQDANGDDYTVAIGKGVRAPVSGGKATRTYDVSIPVTLSNNDVLVGVFPVEVRT